jgi:hypothetical protein
MPPTLLEPPQRPRVSKSLYRKWNWRRQVVASGLRLTALALLVLLGWGGWYLANRGFSREWRTTVANELRKRGVEASVRRLTLDPFRGLVAQDLRIYDFKNRDKPLATISEVSLDINYAALLHRQPFINAIDVRDADVTFPNPGGDPNAPKAQLKQFRAHVYFPPSRSHQPGGRHFLRRPHLGDRSVDQAERLPADAGRHRRGMATTHAAPAADRGGIAGDHACRRSRDAAGEVLRRPRANGRRAHRGEPARRAAPPRRVRDPEDQRDGEWKDRKLNIAQFTWTDSAGEFNARASWSALTKEADLQAQSSVNAKAALEAFGFANLVRDLTFATPPVIEFTGNAEFR